MSILDWKTAACLLLILFGIGCDRGKADGSGGGGWQYPNRTMLDENEALDGYRTARQFFQKVLVPEKKMALEEPLIKGMLRDIDIQELHVVVNGKVKTGAEDLVRAQFDLIGMFRDKRLRCSGYFDGVMGSPEFTWHKDTFRLNRCH